MVLYLFASLVATTASAQPGAPPPVAPPQTAPAPADPGTAQVAPSSPQVHETRRLMEAPAYPPPMAMSPVPAPTSFEISHRRMPVRIDSSHPNAVVERRVSTKDSTGAFLVLPFRSTDTTWEQICVTPCTVDIDRFSTYRVSAQNHISGSRTFTLPQNTDALHLKLKTGSLVAHRTGELMTGVGLVAVIVGGSLLITASNFKHPTPTEAREAGGITLGAGVLFAAIGLPLAIASRTRVRMDTDEEIANTYFNKGHEVPFLPKLNLGNGFTLTQRGIIF